MVWRRQARESRYAVVVMARPRLLARMTTSGNFPGLRPPGSLHSVASFARCGG
jgi:hypothetical protein